MFDLFMSKAVYLDYAYIEYLKLIHFRKKTMFLIFAPKHCFFSRAFVDCRAFDRGIASKGENGEAVYVMEKLPFLQDTIDLAFEKCFRLISHICFQRIEITS